MRILRYVLAFLAGAIVAGFVVAGLEALGHAVYPPPVGIDPGDIEQIKAAVAAMPVGALLFVLFAWVAGAYAGGLVAARLAPGRRGLLAAVVGALVLAAVVANLAMIPHPLWFAALGILAVLASTSLAVMAGRRRDRVETEG
ncbi:hypothetical protein [Arenimonas aestuarii]